MARSRWILRPGPDGEVIFIPADRDTFNRSNKALGVITDSMEPTLHPATGEYLSSKSRFRQSTRAAGCVEVGNDWNSERYHPGTRPPEGRKEALVEAYQRVRDGYRPPEPMRVSEFIKEHGDLRLWKS